MAGDPTGPVIGVDLGGTKVLIGAVDPDLAIRTRVRREVRDLSRQDLLDVLVAAVEEARGGIAEEPLAVGVGVPATVSPRTGRTWGSTHLPIADLSIAEVLGERIGLPVFVDNDATCAAVAEHRHGAAFGSRDAVVMTLGTGIGAGLISGDRVVRGANGAAGELGHIPVEPNGLPCGAGCPSSGCLETRVSGPALEREAERIAVARPESALGKAAGSGPLHGARVVELAHDGDLAALEAVGAVGNWLGVGLVAVTNLLDPEVIVIGGGLAAAGELLLEPARSVLAERGLPPGSGATVTTARFGADAGLLGASLIARDGLSGVSE
ncbi:MAG: ROK family protein [Actinomycetes bacterium]